MTGFSSYILLNQSSIIRTSTNNQYSRKMSLSEI